MRSLYQLIDFVLWFYSLLLIIYVVTGLLINFGVVNAYNRVVSGIYEFLMRVTEPVLRPIRRILPNFGPVDLSPLVTHRFALDDIQDAFDLFSHQRDRVLKVALTPSAPAPRRDARVDEGAWASHVL